MTDNTPPCASYTRLGRRPRNIPLVMPPRQFSTMRARSLLLVHHGIREILLPHMSPKPVYGQLLVGRPIGNWLIDRRSWAERCVAPDLKSSRGIWIAGVKSPFRK